MPSWRPEGMQSPTVHVSVVLINGSTRISPTKDKLQFQNTTHNHELQMRTLHILNLHGIRCSKHNDVVISLSVSVHPHGVSSIHLLASLPSIDWTSISVPNTVCSWLQQIVHVSSITQSPHIRSLQKGGELTVQLSEDELSVLSVEYINFLLVYLLKHSQLSSLFHSLVSIDILSLCILILGVREGELMR